MFELAAPWVLVIIPLPLLLWFFLPQSQATLTTALKIPFFDAMSGIVAQEKRSIAAQSSLLLPAIIWLLLVTALSGPRWVGQPLPMSRAGYNIMMALDLSGSMDITDMVLRGRPVNRLTVVKRAAKQFVDDRAGDRIGLILFGTRAYLQTPLTYDRHSVLMRLDDATVGLAGKTTSIGDAVGLAVKRLEQVPRGGKVIILLTDGANNSGMLSPLKAAELAKDDSIKIYTIGLGSATDPNVLSPDFSNPAAASDLDEDTLQKMAKMTGGTYFRATDTETLQTVYNTINQLEAVEQEQATIRPQHDYYPCFLGVALALLFFLMASRVDIPQHLKRRIARQEGFEA